MYTYRTVSFCGRPSIWYHSHWKPVNVVTHGQLGAHYQSLGREESWGSFDDGYTTDKDQRGSAKKRKTKRTKRENRMLFLGLLIKSARLIFFFSFFFVLFLLFLRGHLISHGTILVRQFFYSTLVAFPWYHLFPEFSSTLFPMSASHP